MEHNGTIQRALPDYLTPGLRLIIVGLNPGVTSALRGHYYAGPGNMFWRGLHAAGLTPRLLCPDEDHLLPGFGIGVTDIIGRATASVSQVPEAEWRREAHGLAQRLGCYRPAALCFNGLAGARAVLGPETRLGLQPQRFIEALTFVVPSTSRRNAHYTREEVLDWFRALGEAVRSMPQPVEEGGR